MLQNQGNDRNDRNDRFNRSDLFVIELFEDYSHPFIKLADTEEPPSDSYSYQNVASCPDCSGGMVRLGSCFSCPSCGFESCSI